MGSSSTNYGSIGALTGTIVGNIVAPGVGGALAGAALGGLSGYMSGKSSYEQAKAQKAQAAAIETANAQTVRALNKTTLSEATETISLDRQKKRSILNGLTGSKLGYSYSPAGSLSSSGTGKTLLGQ